MHFLKSTAPFPLNRQLTTGKLSAAALLVQAFWQLVRVDFLLRRGNFAALYQTVCGASPKSAGFDSGVVDTVCRAVDRASVLYWKQVLCLQRSTAAVCLLRRFGVPAELIIGVQTFPVRAHAWVEIEGEVVNDKPYMREMYQVL